MRTAVVLATSHGGLSYLEKWIRRSYNIITSRNYVCNSRRIIGRQHRFLGTGGNVDVQVELEVGILLRVGLHVVTDH